MQMGQQMGPPMPPHMQMGQQMPSQMGQQIDNNLNQQIIGKLPQNYNGSIPSDLINNMPMVGGNNSNFELHNIPKYLKKEIVSKTSNINSIAPKQQINKNLIDRKLNKKIMNEVSSKYNGLVPLELINNLPMVGGYSQKKNSKLKNEGGKQLGGSGRIIPSYIDDRNTPFKSKERKVSETTHYKEANFKNQNNAPNNSLFEVKVSNDLIQKPPRRQIVYPHGKIPIVHNFPNNWPYPQNNGYAANTNGINHMYPWLFTQNYETPVINKYNISLGNLNGDPIKIGDLYEDILPTEHYKNTTTTIEERKVISEYVRSRLVSVNDGEDIDITGTYKSGGGANRKNILSYLKLLELNPNHDNELTPNPYTTLPDNMLIYRSCYPIRYNNQNNQITCARTSIGLNLRLYNLNVGELNASQLNSELNRMDYHIWRELAFYELIREDI